MIRSRLAHRVGVFGPRGVFDRSLGSGSASVLPLPGVSMTLNKNGSMTLFFWVMTPFFKGHGDSRYGFSDEFGQKTVLHRSRGPWGIGSLPFSSPQQSVFTFEALFWLGAFARSRRTRWRCTLASGREVWLKRLGVYGPFERPKL